MNDSPTLRIASPSPPVLNGSVADFARDPIHMMRQLWALHGEVAALQEDTNRLFFVFGPTLNHSVLTP